MISGLFKAVVLLMFTNQLAVESKIIFCKELAIRISAVYRLKHKPTLEF